MDISKLTPAPWFAYEGTVMTGPLEYGFGPTVACCCYEHIRHGKEKSGFESTDVELAHFIALARNAFDVMMRRGWYVVPQGETEPYLWGVRTNSGHDLPLKFLTSEPWTGVFNDPFTALVEANRWYRENVEKVS